MKLKFKKFLSKAVPLWMVLLIVLNSTLIMGIIQFALMRQELNKNIQQLAKSTKSPQELAQILKQEVLPQKGYVTSLKWQDLAKKLVEAGAIDPEKFTFSPDPQEDIKIDEQNSREIVNFFWALGLTQKNKVLDEGPMKKGETSLGNFASTGGWTLGKKDAVLLYSSVEIFPLNGFQQDLVKKISDNVFRPCCGNPTSFPDCNHGMAALGYIEWAVYNGLSEEQIYKDLLAFNSFWFPQNYLEMAMYFDKQNIKWKDVDPKLALSSAYSSAQGAQRIKQTVQSVPGVGGQGGGCGV